MQEPCKLFFLLSLVYEIQQNKNSNERCVQKHIPVASIMLKVMTTERNLSVKCIVRRFFVS